MFSITFCLMFILFFSKINFSGTVYISAYHYSTGKVEKNLYEKSGYNILSV